MKFLIVDDSPTTSMLLGDILSPYGQCDPVADGREAVDAFELALEDNEPYDLICLDIMMPGMDGHETLDAIRKMEHQWEIFGSDAVSVIMTTALSDPKHYVKAFRGGCEGYATKPIDQRQFLDQVRLLVPGFPGPEGQPRYAEDTSDDAASQTAPDRYLIVDDDGLCRVLLTDILSHYGQCAMAADGQEAVDAVRLSLEENRPYDLICLDIMMPGINGHDTLTAIRALEDDHDIHGSNGAKVIMTTAMNDAPNIIRSFREGCESYVLKPIDATELLAKMGGLGLSVSHAEVGYPLPVSRMRSTGTVG